MSELSAIILLAGLMSLGNSIESAAKKLADAIRDVEP